ncbi:glycosyltransferase [Actimicrobium sp. CCC2.4]|uniref:glycosyltransferase n=1 Tax=Actimicrobium sp. CCC2.4 TaxID=3048606 RepID=UPI002AC9D93A|nr:glycosyltransferase [Actimicrobium sp. CCC2.4]MEB0136049.1 glycosyltransferase [Actimicrobium sp. CCC2.4]WPX32193.1 glycosyltransferase [Actimicrobium sp. CCC2.4]
MTIFICAPDIFSGDAVGNHCLGIARCVRRLGYDAEIYAQRFTVGNHDIRPVENIFKDIRSDDILVVSYSILDPFLDRLLQINCRKICYFHGVTQPALLQDIDPVTAELCQRSIDQLPKLCGFDVVVANSLSSKNYLSGFINGSFVSVIPPVFYDMPIFQHKPVIRGSDSSAKRLLMVGRVVPHKCIEDGISLVSMLRKLQFPATLSVVGSMPNYEYVKYLINFARNLNILDTIEFNGTLDDIDLFYCYENSDALIVMSRHEGYCVPVLEAMHFGTSVVVRGGTAAEEICLSNDVMRFDDDLSRWVEVLLERLNSPRPDLYTKKGQLFLERSNDGIWADILFIDGRHIQ